MIDLTKDSFEVKKRIDVIDETLAINEKNMIHQCQEIMKTESLISEYQCVLKKQNELLKEYIVSKEKLENDKVMLMKLLADQETGQKLLLEENNERDVSQITNKTRLPLFNDKYQINTSTKSLKYYRTINDKLSDLSPLNTIRFPNQTAIPNQLKATTCERSMVLYRIDLVGEYHLKDIVGQAITMSIDIHVSMGMGELISIRGDNTDIQYYTTPITASKTYSIRQFQTTSTEFTLLVHTAPMVVAIDIYNSITSKLATMDDLEEPQGYSLMSLTKESNDSFMKRNLSLTEIRKRLLFIDANFAESIQRDLVPIELCVIDYQAKVLINTVICPRVPIKDYRQSEHGHSEKDIIGSPDSEEMMKYFYTVIWDKILIGHGLRDKIRDLKIHLKFVCGIKDLQSNFVFNSEKSLYDLDEISHRVLKTPRQNGIKSALENTETMRNIYLFMETLNSESFTGEDNAGSAETRSNQLSECKYEPDHLISKKIRI